MVAGGTGFRKQAMKRRKKRKCPNPRVERNAKVIRQLESDNDGAVAGTSSKHDDVDLVIAADDVTAEHVVN